MKRNPFQDVKHVWATHVPAAATAAVATIAAVAKERWVLDFVHWNYNAGPTAGALTIVFTQGGTAITITRTIGTTAGAGVLDLSGAPIVGDVNTAITITLASGGGSVKGEVHARYH